jgi:hypothetical protein
MWADDQGLFQGGQQLCQQVGQNVSNLRWVAGASGLHLAPDFVQQPLGGGYAGVGHEEGGFKLFVQRVVDAGAGEDLLMLEPVLRKPALSRPNQLLRAAAPEVADSAGVEGACGTGRDWPKAEPIRAARGAAGSAGAEAACVGAGVCAIGGGAGAFFRKKLNIDGLG